ncbi:nucleotidyltransferase-like protein [Cohnella nanjingensis]|uniref:nucleotidyltransferase-like protein n=1 Tax=Cohnella nanjingensis TaxID=1387779 RepID=UPI0028A8C1DC|nr:nucleotidyltransferase-like protein [Cohnella nanjingensis]
MRRLDEKGLFYTDLFGHDEALIGLMLIKNLYAYQTLIDGMDRLVLAVYDHLPDASAEAEHWMWEDTRIQVRRVTPERLDAAIVRGEQRGIIQWLVQGEVLFDKAGYLERTKRRLDEWPAEMKEQKLLCEYSRYLRTYLHAKQDLKDGQVMDAYTNILASLNYWAHIALIEDGMHPELTVWEQMRRVNPGIYKLYEELTASQETLEQRVHLVLLAVEFSVLTKMKSSCALLTRILADRQQPWSVSELQRHSQLAGLSLDLSLMLQKLAMRGYIREVAKPVRQLGVNRLELRYAALLGE